MQTANFAILENKVGLAHAYICYGNFNECEESFSKSLVNTGVKLRSPGHYIFESDTFGVPDARELVEWYHSGKTHNDDTHTVAVIAAKVIKKDAQQMLLKILEEARAPYSFFIFAEPGVEIIDTVLSRVQNLGQINDDNSEIKKFVLMNAGEKIKKVAGDIKGMESSEVRAYTEKLVRDLMFYFNKNKKDNYLEKLEILMRVQKTLSDSQIAPKFILDYLVAVI